MYILAAKLKYKVDVDLHDSDNADMDLHDSDNAEQDSAYEVEDSSDDEYLPKSKRAP